MSAYTFHASNGDRLVVEPHGDGSATFRIQPAIGGGAAIHLPQARVTDLAQRLTSTAATGDAYGWPIYASEPGA